MERPELPTTAILALALAACTGEAEDTTYAIGASDENGQDRRRVTHG